MLLGNHNPKLPVQVLNRNLIVGASKFAVQRPWNLFQGFKSNAPGLERIHMLGIHLLDEKGCHDLLQGKRILRRLNQCNLEQAVIKDHLLAYHVAEAAYRP